MANDPIVDQLNELSKLVGELRGEVKLILKKLDGMEQKYNGYVEKTIRVEEKLVELKKAINDHLHEHKQETNTKTRLKIATIGAVSGSASAFFFTLLLKLMGM
jgi:chromosome segregation ATPase